jgi:hypothetical protein
LIDDLYFFYVQRFRTGGTLAFDYSPAFPFIMLTSFSIAHVICMAGLCLLNVASAAAQSPDSTGTRPHGTLVKLGTGIVPPAFELGGYRGLSAPLIVSVEHHLSPAVSVYASGFSGFNVRRQRYYDGSRESIIDNYGFDAGVRYYYNQEKRRQKGRATGPFVGNYLALQTSSVFNANYYHKYRYSGITALWGMQRRIGKYGWFDAYAGLGIGREPTYYSGRYGILPELGIKFSLGNSLTH